MSEPTEDPSTTPAVPEDAPHGLARQTCEFLVILCLTVLIFRTFAAEAYIVPTGSMAPTLLGQHREVVCPNCEYRLVLGVDEEGRPSGRALCPNCGQSGLDSAPAVESSGDRVLVQKFVYDVRRPKRWEVAVFHFPGDPTQAYVKRVVGLPGESLRVIRGDVWVDGRIARKTLKEQRAIRVPVFDNNFVPRDSDRVPRWSYSRGRPSERLASGWTAEGTRFVHELPETFPKRTDWVDYRHWEPDRARYAPVHDFNAYNGAEVRGENVVTDLAFEARVVPAPDARVFSVRIDSGSDRFVVEFPLADEEPPVLAWNGRVVRVDAGKCRLNPGEGGLVEVSVMDRRVTASVNGVLAFEPFDYDTPANGVGPGSSPVAFGARGGGFSVSGVKVFRDVYYTSSLASTPRRPFGVDEPYRLGVDEFFVLGDNSPVSNDSRFWADSPVVPGEYFLGKPFLVHLPGQVVPLRVFGRSLYWVPDPREIRYIR